MAKYKVTPELATLLKLLRTRNHISGRSVAEAIGKSVSYVSRLEKGEIKTIQEPELTEMLKFLTPGQDFYNQALPDIVALARTFPNAEDVLHQPWLTSYDVVLRPIEVPAGLVDYFKGCMAQLEISAADLASHINNTEDLPFYEELMPNEPVVIELQEGSILLTKSHIDAEQLEGILDGSVGKSTYFDLLGIAYALIRETEFADQPITLEVGSACIHASYDVLAKFGVHSLTHFIGAIGRQVDNSGLPANSLTELFEVSGRQSLGRIDALVQSVASYDAVATSQALDQLAKSLQWDPSFALRVMGLPLSDLGEMSYSYKKQLLEDMEALIDKYRRIPPEKRRLERY